MSLILLATFLSGAFLNWLCLAAGVEAMLVRYPMGVVLAYASFYLWVRLWLAAIRSGRSRSDVGDVGDLVDGTDFLDPVFIPGPGRKSEPVFSGGGGRSGAGGASASWGVAEAHAGVEDRSAGGGVSEALKEAADGAWAQRGAMTRGRGSLCSSSGCLSWFWQEPSSSCSGRGRPSWVRAPSSSPWPREWRARRGTSTPRAGLAASSSGPSCLSWCSSAWRPCLASWPVASALWPARSAICFPGSEASVAEDVGARRVQRGVA